MIEPLLIGIDIGTTAVKGAAYTLGGRLEASTVRHYEFLPALGPGWAEQDPEWWMLAIQSILRQVQAELQGSSFLAIGLTSQVNTHVFTDAAGNPVLPAITWQDLRCHDSAELLNDRIEDSIRTSVSDAVAKVDSSSLLSRAHWLSSHHPDVWQKTKYVFSPKDFCLYHLTGTASADALSSIGLVDKRGRYSWPIVDLVDGLLERLPPLGAVTEVVGRIHPKFGFGQCPVNLGVMDAWASLYGSGAVHHGDAFQVAGTSEVIGVHSDQAYPAEGVITFPPVPGWYLHAGPTQLGGDAANWLAGYLGMDISEVFTLAAAAKNLGEPLLFLPHLMGERAPLWDAKAKGVLAGMTKRHTQSDLAYAVLEGVAFAARALVERLECAAGTEIKSIRLSGGAARSDLWCQIKADVLNRRLARLENIDAGAFGAAVLAGVAVGEYASVIEATETAVREDRAFEPRKSRRKRADFMYESYLETYQAMKATCHRLHDFARQWEGMGPQL